MDRLAPETELQEVVLVPEMKHPIIEALVPVSAQVFMGGPVFWFVEAHTKEGRYVKMHMFKTEAKAHNWASKTMSKIMWKRMWANNWNVKECEEHEMTCKPGWWTYIGPCP